MTLLKLLLILAIGAAAGWIATKVVRGQGFGLLVNMIIGVVGGVLGGWLLPRLGVVIGGGLVSSLITATLGAIVLVLAAVGLQKLGVLPKRIGK